MPPAKAETINTNDKPIIEVIAEAKSAGHYPFMRDMVPGTIEPLLEDLKAQFQAGTLRIQIDAIAIKEVSGSPREIAAESARADLLISLLPLYKKVVAGIDGAPSTEVEEVIPDAKPFELLQLPNVASTTSYLRPDTINRLIDALAIFDEDLNDPKTLARSIIEQVKKQFMMRAENGDKGRTKLLLKSALDRNHVSDDEEAEQARLDALRARAIQLEISELQVDAAQAQFSLAYLQRIEAVAIDIFGAENIPTNPKEKMDFLGEFQRRFLELRQAQEWSDTEIERAKALAAVYKSMKFFLQWGRLGWIGTNSEVASVMNTMVAVAAVKVGEELATDDMQRKALLLGAIASELAKANATTIKETGGQVGQQIGMTVQGITVHTGQGLRSFIADLGIGIGEGSGSLIGKPLEKLVQSGQIVLKFATEEPEIPITLMTTGGAITIVLIAGTAAMVVPAAVLGAGLGLSATYLGKKVFGFLSPIVSERISKAMSVPKEK